MGPRARRRTEGLTRGAIAVSTLIPYGRQSIDEADIAAVVAALRSDWLTQGPRVQAFEDSFAARVGARHAVAVNSGTAALHAAMHALRIGPGDEVIVPAITFTATANCVLFQGGTPVFADVDPASGLIDAASVAARLTPRTRAIIAVDYAGHPADYDALAALAARHGVALVADACHSLGGRYRGRAVGTLASLSCFSFHPVKHIATGEGGLVATDDAGLAQRLRDFRTHGITRQADRLAGLGADGGALAERGPWYYEMLDLGFNYRICDINCALGLSQLGKLDAFVARRREIAAAYGRGLAGLPRLALPSSDLQAAGADDGTRHAFHLYPVRIDFAGLGRTRTQVMADLAQRGVGTQVHYIPVCLQPYYRQRLGFAPGHCPGAERYYAQTLSIPMFPALAETEVERVIAALRELLEPR